MSSFNFDAEIKQHLTALLSLRQPNGVFTAAPKETWYGKAWLRDIYFCTLGFLETGDLEVTKSAAKALLSVFVKHQDKINWAIEHKPHYAWQYIHARFHPETFEEYWEEWGNSQNDAVGEVLNLLCELELRGESVIETDDERSMVQKIIDYLVRLEYWQDADNGIWEENMEVLRLRSEPLWLVCVRRRRCRGFLCPSRHWSRENGRCAHYCHESLNPSFVTWRYCRSFTRLL